ncbi:MAG: hypothetical protein IT306_09715 [Chloroflexi bacterium]|nr:hypothetical protein [Chloroflexota bacterium]
MRVRAVARGVLAAAVAVLSLGSLVVSAQEPTSIALTPEPAKTIALHRCGGATLSTATTNCMGFTAGDILTDPSIFVVGFESNKDLAEKHVLQVAMQFDLTKITVGPNQAIDFAELMFSEVSTTKRSAAGESEYGILTSCNTKLGVPTSAWNGSTDRLIATQPAKTDGMTPATTAESGVWNVLPQVLDWVAAGQQKGVLVLGADDQSADIREMSACLSYLTDAVLTVQVSEKPQ